MIHRRGFAALLFLLLTISLAFGGSNGVGLSVNGALGTAGQLLGTTTNDNACAGCVGARLFSNIPSASNVSLTTGTAADVTTLSLTAGQWLCWGNVAFNANAATTMSGIFTWISSTSATLPTQPNGGAEMVLTTTYTTGSGPTLPTGAIVFQVATTTPVYLSTRALFAVNTLAAYGYFECDRTR